MVRAMVPAVLVEAAASVKVLVPAPGEAMLAGAKVAVTPDGRPLTENATAELKPLTRAVVMVMAADPPGATLALAALEVSVKLGAGTVRLKVFVMVRVPAFAVIVTVEAPTTAVEPAVKVNVLCPEPGAAMLAGAKVDVTPLGSPLIDSAMAELNPVPPAVVTVMAVDAVRATLAVVALNESVKVPETVRLRACVFVTPPPVAVTVTVKVPAAAVEAAARVRTLLPAPGEAMLAGANDAVTPLGRPLAESATAAPNPFTRVVVKVKGIDPPGVTLALVALDDSVKLGARTVRLEVRVLVMPPPVALTANE